MKSASPVSMVTQAHLQECQRTFQSRIRAGERDLEDFQQALDSLKVVTAPVQQQHNNYTTTTTNQQLHYHNNKPTTTLPQQQTNNYTTTTTTNQQLHYHNNKPTTTLPQQQQTNNYTTTTTNQQLHYHNNHTTMTITNKNYNTTTTTMLTDTLMFTDTPVQCSQTDRHTCAHRRSVSPVPQYSAAAVVGDSEALFSDLAQRVEQTRGEVRARLEAQEKAVLSRVEHESQELDREVSELRRREEEIAQLLLTEDNSQFLRVSWRLCVCVCVCVCVCERVRE